METFLVVCGALAALPGLLAALHLSGLAVASLVYREPILEGRVPRLHFLVLVPAHNEERGIARTLESVNAVLRPGDQTLVVADNCSDETAVIATRLGALVLERVGTPGRAEARQAGLDFARDLEWDAVAMVDADSILEPGFLDACERPRWRPACRRSKHEAKELGQTARRSSDVRRVRAAGRHDTERT